MGYIVLYILCAVFWTALDLLILIVVNDFLSNIIRLHQLLNIDPASYDAIQVFLFVYGFICALIMAFPTTIYFVTALKSSPQEENSIFSLSSRTLNGTLLNRFTLGLLANYFPTVYQLHRAVSHLKS